MKIVFSVFHTGEIIDSMVYHDGFIAYHILNERHGFDNEYNYYEFEISLWALFRLIVSEGVATVLCTFGIVKCEEGGRKRYRFLWYWSLPARLWKRFVRRFFDEDYQILEDSRR